MEDFEKIELNSVKRLHFRKIHERVQNKYHEMQRKLEKSKSIDSLLALSDESLYTEQKYSSKDNIKEIDEEKSDLKPNVKYSLTVEDVHKNNAKLNYVCYKEAEISECETPLPVDVSSKVNSVNSNEQIFFNDDFSKTSLESLNEVAKESTDQVPPTPSPKISIRNKIGSRISAAKEKRLREEKEKISTKDKKKESREKVEKLVLTNTTKQDLLKTFKRTRIATVTIALIDATGLETNVLEEKSRLLFCRFRLGAEKYKSKPIKTNTREVKWQELFNINMYEEHNLEIYLWDRDILLGKSVVDLSQVRKEKTHKMRINLEGEVLNVQIFILLTISGTSLVNTVVDDYLEAQKNLDCVGKEFASRDEAADVGWLSIILYGAKGLTSSDCYCVLELGNNRLQTQTEFKTQDPNWMKIFAFSVTDITSILELTVCDEKKSEEVAKISIPLLKIINGKRKWYALKDISQKEKAKGNNPRILLEMKVNWNLFKASIRVISPKEIKYIETEEKFQRHVLARNWSRTKAVLSWILDAFKVIKSCFEWESRKLNIIALTIWLLFCWIFKIWMLPLLLLIPFLRYMPEKYYLVNWPCPFMRREKNELMEADTLIEKEEKTSIRQKLQSLQEMIQTVQNFIGSLASRGESVKNLFNFTVPYLSFLAIFMIIVIAFVMYMIPLNYLLMAWGVHKFTRKILRPNRIPNNEILDLLSRVPDDDILLNCEELPLKDLPDEDVIK